jgi:hypothetical protein
MAIEAMHWNMGHDNPAKTTSNTEFTMKRA